MHECDRVYRDKLVDLKDMEMFDKIQQDMTRKFFEVRAMFVVLSSKPQIMALLTPQLTGCSVSRI